MTETVCAQICEDFAFIHQFKCLILAWSELRIQVNIPTFTK